MSARIIKVICGVCILFAIGIVSAAHLSPVKNSSPNIILILMDDMGYGDPVFNAGIGYSTPNIDKLAADGMRFTNFYAAQPV